MIVHNIAGTYLVVRLQSADRSNEVKSLFLQCLHQIFACRSNILAHPILRSNLLQDSTAIQHCIGQEAVGFATNKVQFNDLLLAKCTRLLFTITVLRELLDRPFIANSRFVVNHLLAVRGTGKRPRPRLVPLPLGQSSWRPGLNPS